MYWTRRPEAWIPVLAFPVADCDTFILSLDDSSSGYFILLRVLKTTMQSIQRRGTEVAKDLETTP